MNALTAKPKLLKQANLSLIRKVIKNKHTATRAEIAYETKISSTTVRSLLTEMVNRGEIESIGHDESSGGRKAERYGFRFNEYFCVTFCIIENQVYGLLVNVCGEIVKKTKLAVSNDDYESAITVFIDGMLLKRKIKSIGIGVPGIVEGGGYWRKNEYDELYKVNIGENLSKRYEIPVIMENDLNAVAIGFGRCYEKEKKVKDSESANMAFIHFEKGCVSAGFIIGGRVVRGCNNFAGELGLIPMHYGKSLDECMAELVSDEQYINYLVRIVGWVCGIINPQYVALGGSEFRQDFLGVIRERLDLMLPKNMRAEVLYATDVWHDYFDGMAYLTAEKMFDDIQFTKE